MRFTRFPRVEQPNPPSARRIAAARRAVQAEQDRYSLFPQLVTPGRIAGRIAPTQIDFQRPTSEPLETFMIEIAISCDMSQTFATANEFRPETKTRTRTFPTIDAKPESENRQSVCRRSAKKPDPPHSQKAHRLAQTKSTVSTQSGCGPSAILFPCHFRLAPKLGRRSPIAKFTYCRHSRKIPARSSDRRAAQKMNEPTEVQLDLAPWYTQNASESRTFGAGIRTGGVSVPPPPPARELWFYSSFSMPRSMISAKLTRRPSLFVALSESERMFSWPPLSSRNIIFTSRSPCCGVGKKAVDPLTHTRPLFWKNF